jgi:hypothetical protein
MAVSCAIPYCIGISIPFPGHMTLGTRFLWRHKKTRRFSIMCPFRGLFHTVFGFSAPFLGPVTRPTRLTGNTRNSSFYGRFGVWAPFLGPVTLGTRFQSDTKNSSF